jgi:S-adenosylmethionine:tRNA ribosyltransferase-isomerase
MQLSDFDYELPVELIAQFPLPERSASRLLALDAVSGELQDLAFTDLPQLLRPGDLLVFNDTQVMQARLYGWKATGGRLEVLVERVLQPDLALVHIRASKSPGVGTLVLLGEERSAAEVMGRRDDLYELLLKRGDFFSLMENQGHVPLPPYIARADQPADLARYQTVYARRPGAVAAPTAGLHFDEPLLKRLTEQGVRSVHLTLHVGAGTFQPVRVENLDEHVMHKEYVEVSEQVCEEVEKTRTGGGRVVAVGTTSVRSLEAASADGRIRPFHGETRLFIRPGYGFRCVDAMITNFHLPQSTLLMLVSAFAGMEEIRRAYRHAIARRYRFFSYGDAMFLTRKAAS